MTRLLMLLINTGESEMTDQCRHCVNRGNITACQSVQCRHHDSWYSMALQAEIDKRDELLLAIKGAFESDDYAITGALLEDVPLKKGE